MRGGRSFLILLVAALGLGAYIYFVESEREPAGARVAEKEKIFTVEPGTIEEVTVRNTEGETTTVRKTGDEWQIVAPATIEANATAVSTLVSAIEGLEAERVVDENPTDLAPFGLASPRLRVAFKVAGDAAERALLIGERTPTGSDLYAKVDGETRLLLIASYLEDSLGKSTFDLRDKSILEFQRDSVESLVIDRLGQPAMTLARKDTTWRITAPVNAKADFTGVDGLVGRLFQAEMQALVFPKDPTATDEPSAADLRDFGLDRPAVTVTLGSGSSRTVLAIGGTEGTSRYARDLSRPYVFTIESSLYDDLVKNPDDLRAKDVFAFRSFTAVGLEMSVDGTAATFAKTTPPASADASAPAPTPVWKLTAPSAKDLEETKMTDLLTTVSNLRAESFVARPHAEGQTVVVTARFGDAASPTVERVTFRKSGDAVHAIVDGEPGAAVVSTADFDRVLTLFKELTSAQ